MPRPLRLQYEGAWYHVMNRGANHCKIFLEQKHYKIFLHLLEKISYLFTVEVHAYCLMTNHYHLLLHTPHGNLGKAMKHLNGIYTQQFNRGAGKDGALFRGRYRSLLIEHEAYLLQVSRYIHLNPLSINLTTDHRDYEWSSYSAYLHEKKSPAWLCTGEILSQSNGRESYRDYVEQGRGLTPFLSLKHFDL